MAASEGGVRLHTAVTPGGTQHKTRLYELTAHKSDAFSDKIFTGSAATSKVCKLMRQETGHADAGCEDAAAFTSWHISIPPGWVLYNGQGVKAPGPGAIIPVIATTLPAHRPPGRGVPHRDALDIKRFLTTLAIHERGHGSMGDQVVTSFKAVCDALPDRVPAEQAAAVNAALIKYLKDVLEAGARRADVAYDAYTGHGLTQGAQSGAMDSEDAVAAFLKGA